MSIPDHTGQACQIINITTEQQLAAVCQLPKAIIYIEVDWSDHERQSRQTFHQALQCLPVQEVPVFMIDCSGQQHDFFENWLITQERHVHLFYTGGYGETVLVQYGQVTDFINYPARSGLEKTTEKIKSWL